MIEKQQRVLVPKIPKIQGKLYQYPIEKNPILSKEDSGFRMVQDVSGEIAVYLDPVYRSHPKPVKPPITKISWKLTRH